MEKLILKPQEIPLNHPDSHYFFTTFPFVATSNAIRVYGEGTIVACLLFLHKKAKMNQGLDYLQVFQDPTKKRPDLWFIDDGEGGATTALLPEDY